MPKKIKKSADTIVPDAVAKENPETTFETEVVSPIFVGEIEPPQDVLKPTHLGTVGTVKKSWKPAIGEKFELNGEIASIDANGVVTIHEIVGGCQSERIVKTSLDGATYLSPDEAFRRLA